MHIFHKWEHAWNLITMKKIKKCIICGKTVIEEWKSA